jgi:modulator of FtsH protease
MSDTSTAYLREGAVPRAIATAQLLGQVMFLVAVSIGFCALGTVIGRDLSLGAARACSFAGFGMLLVSSFAGERFRVGSFAMGWLFATALLIGLGLGPVIGYFATVEPSALSQAAGGTAATVLATGSLGFVLSRDLARWMRPLALIVFALCCGTVWLATGIFVGIVNIFISLLNIFSSR